MLSKRPRTSVLVEVLTARLSTSDDMVIVSCNPCASDRQPRLTPMHTSSVCEEPGAIHSDATHATRSAGSSILSRGRSLYADSVCGARDTRASTAGIISRDAVSLQTCDAAADLAGDSADPSTLLAMLRPILTVLTASCHALDWFGAAPRARPISSCTETRMGRTVT